MFFRIYKWTRNTVQNYLLLFWEEMNKDLLDIKLPRILLSEPKIRLIK